MSFKKLFGISLSLTFIYYVFMYIPVHALGGTYEDEYSLTHIGVLLKNKSPIFLWITLPLNKVDLELHSCICQNKLG